MTLTAPMPLTEQHVTDGFLCGVDSLDVWLKRRSLKNQIQGASRTYVVCDETRVVAYYALASGAITSTGATGRFRRNMPDPIPVIVLARLAVSVQFHGLGLGAALLQDAAYRCQRVAEHAGVRAMLVHALDERAAAFYRYHGFIQSPVQPMTLMLAMRRP